ncbi:MAG: LuxR C-terminal-related transcriptional regulator, partial [Acidobacteriota bacterium]
ELRDPSALAALHRTAATAERAAGDAAAAVRHLLAAGDRQEAFELVFGPVWDLYRSGSTRDLAIWFDQFPDDFVGSDPDRIITFATTLSLMGRLDDAASWNDRATALLGSQESDSSGLTFSRILVELGRGDTVAVRRQVEALESAVDPGASRWNPPAAIATVLALCALVDDDIVGARRWVEAIADTPALPERARAVGHPARRAWLALEEGRFDEAAQLSDASLAEIGDERRGAAHAITELFVVKVRLATERLDVDAADLWSERAVDLAAELSTPLYRFLAHAAQLGAIELRSGSTTAASVANDLARGEVSEALLPRYQLLAAELAARAGHSDVASHHLADLPATPRRRLVEARVGLGRGGFAPARALLEDTQGLQLRLQIQAELLRYLAAPDEIAHLDRALGLGARRGFVWTYLREGSEIVDALRRLVVADARWGSTRLADALLGQRGTSPTSHALIEPLSPKETQVLQLFPTHLSTVEMASQLFVSASTVRTHVKAIYRKLEVNSRSEAVVRAQVLGLIGRSGTPARA